VESKWHIDKYLKDFDKSIEDVLEVIGSQMVTYSTDLCPVKTGNLTNSIAYSTESVSSPVHGSPTDGKPLEKADKSTVRIGSNVAYAARIEYGFSGTDSLGRTYNQPEKSYLRKALETHKKDIVKIIELAVKGNG